MAKKTPTEQLLDEADKLAASGRLSPDEYQARRAAILSGQVTPPGVKSGRGGIFKWGMLGCLGMFAAVGVLVILVLVVLGAAISSTKDSTSDSGGDVHVRLAAGASGEIAPESNGSKKSKVTILKIADPVQSTSQFFQPHEGQRWVGFEVSIENTGSKQVGALQWTLRDSADGEHNRAFVPGAQGADVDIVYSDLSPGGKKQGWVYFEIPVGTTIKWLRADPNPFLADDLYFDGP